MSGLSPAIRLMRSLNSPAQLIRYVVRECRVARLDYNFLCERPQARYRSGSQNRSALQTNQLGIFQADCGVVRDAGGRHDERPQSAGMRFDFAQLFGADESQSVKAVRFSAPPQFFQAGKLCSCRGDDDFAADLVRDAVLPAEFDHGARAFDAQLGFQRTGLVVEFRNE